MESKTFCILPFSHQYINNEGCLGVCCTSDDFDNLLKNKNSKNLRIEDVNSNDDVLNSEKLIEMRKQMLEGNTPKACFRCFEDEKSGAKSRRIFENENYKDFIPEVLLKTKSSGEMVGGKILSADYRLGNTCNLKCLMCSPIATKAWINDWNKTSFEKIPESKLEELNKLNWHESIAFEDIVLKISSGVRSIHFAGGEPFLINNLKSILERLVENKLSSEIKLTFNTNATIIPSWLNLLTHFKSSNICISLDGVGKVNDFIRRNSNFQKIVENIKYLDDNYEKLKIDILNISCTVQAANICHLKGLFDFTQKFKNVQKYPMLFNLVYPSYLSSNIIPEIYKHSIVLELLKLESPQIKSVISNLLSKPNANSGIRFLKFLERESLDALETFLELNPIFKKEDFLN